MTGETSLPSVKIISALSPIVSSFFCLVVLNMGPEQNRARPVHPRFSAVLGRDPERKNLWIAKEGEAGLGSHAGRGRPDKGAMRAVVAVMMSVVMGSFPFCGGCGYRLRGVFGSTGTKATTMFSSSPVTSTVRRDTGGRSPGAAGLIGSLLMPAPVLWR